MITRNGHDVHNGSERGCPEPELAISFSNADIKFGIMHWNPQHSVCSSMFTAPTQTLKPSI